MEKIGIIGAGIAGLASAVRMAAKGHEVTVFEANSFPGGKLSEFNFNGYRFDAGPSLFTMPHYVDELFTLAGKNPKDYFNYQKLEVVCHYFWEDGTRLHAHADENLFAQEVEEKLKVPGKRLLHSLQDSREKYEKTGRIFLENSLHKAKTWLKPSVAFAMLKIPKFDLFTTMNKVNEKYARDKKLTQLLNRYATYNGSNPYKAPGLLTIIPHFEHHIGAFYPQGGMVAITNAIYQLALSLGVKFYFEKPVEKIAIKNDKAVGLISEGHTFEFDRVISNMDVFFTYQKLIPKKYHPQLILKQEKSTSALIFYWGIKKIFPELNLHNILFSEDYENEFQHLAEGKVSEDPTVYINITSKYSPEDAPEGCENWFTMVNVPYNSGQNWDDIITRTRKNVINKINRILGVNLEDLLDGEDILEPRTIESRTSSHLGALYGTSSNNKMAAFLRHPNFSNKIKNLYFCGGSAHPGGGIPLCLSSAKIVEECL
jgi:phytoene desaturase